MKNQIVYLVGAGPGDPELITLKGIRVLETADCIIYDYLANPSIVEKYSCEKIFVGKSGGMQTLPQEDINCLLIEKAKQGKIVVRLKGGDPFIFGRGGEEAEALAGEGIPFEIVSGVSSFYSVPAYAGIPVTHRDFANAFEVITGHRRGDASSEEKISLPVYRDDRTFVFLMGVKNLGFITDALIKARNFPENFPAAVISRGTQPDQIVVTGTLKDIAEKADRENIRPPAVILVGSVVSLQKNLQWFDNRPLSGKNIIVTRTDFQAPELSQKLTALGAAVVEFPTIEIKPVKDLSQLEQAFKRFEDYSFLFFTSQNAVNIFFKTLSGAGLDSRALGKIKIAVIGPATGKTLEKYGIRPDIMPEVFSAEGLLKAMKEIDVKGRNVLLPCSEEARSVLAEGLMKQGAQVDRIHIYKTMIPENIHSALFGKLNDAEIITFTSASTAINFFTICKKTHAVFACIGPVTSKAVRDCGQEPVIEASEHTLEGLVQAICEYYKHG